MRLAELQANPPLVLRPRPFLVLVLLSLAVAGPFSLVPFIISYAPPEPPLLAKSFMGLVVAFYLLFVAIAVGVLVPFSRVKITLAMVLASTWPWLVLQLDWLIHDGIATAAVLLPSLPAAIALVLSFVGITIGRGIAARTRATPTPRPTSPAP